MSTNDQRSRGSTVGDVKGEIQDPSVSTTYLSNIKPRIRRIEFQRSGLTYPFPSTISYIPTLFLLFQMINTL